MSKPRTYQTEAIIIKKIKLGEADRILTLCTPHLGKIRAVAKGIRRPRAKLAGHLELLTHSMVSLARGRNLDTIIGSQTINSFLPLKSDLELSAYALYLTELTEQFTPEEQENYPVFQLLLEAMQNLCQAEDRELLLRHFEMHLLQELGYRPQLHQCVACRAELAPVTNYFSPGAGGVICPQCRQNQQFASPLAADTLKVLQFLQDNDYNTAHHLKVNPPLSRHVEWVMREYIKYLLEREIKSAEWLDTLRQGVKQTAPNEAA